MFTRQRLDDHDPRLLIGRTYAIGSLLSPRAADSPWFGDGGTLRVVVTEGGCAMPGAKGSPYAQDAPPPVLGAPLPVGRALVVESVCHRHHRSLYGRRVMFPDNSPRRLSSRKRGSLGAAMPHSMKGRQQ